MKNAIMYYYNLEPLDIHLINKNYKFEINKNYYTLYLCEEDINLEEIYTINQQLLINNIYNHIIILNNNNEISTTIENKRYILFKTYDQMDKDISLDYIINFNNITNMKINKQINWKNMWINKVDYIEYQISEMGYKFPIIRESASYYIGLTENAIMLLDEIKVENFCISHRRININENVFELYNPINFIIDVKVRDACEYFKSKFFYENTNIYESIINYLQSEILNNEEIKLFFIRMMYPSYYFDMYELIIKNDINEKEIIKIINLNHEYEILLKNIYLYIKNIIYIPNIEWLKKI